VLQFVRGPPLPEHCTALVTVPSCSTPSSRTVNTDEQFDATVDRQALKRRLTPDDTAAAVAYLASDAAAVMTGQVLCADGGLIMR
jgi:NAD(P)-dependent dehydrogenase (short-subunit alcohol dehydrogenase family)